ncbi:MAG: hypothetical protein U0835_19585 [Isosphaeraceae bacterium]
MTRATLLTLSAALSLSLSAVLSGCGGESQAAASADPGRAREVLREALDAWKKGDPHGSPSTPVRVADEDWLSGAKLISYRIAPGDEALGARRRCPVVLTLAGRKGKPQTRTVHYDVAIDPAPSVIRLD